MATPSVPLSRLASWKIQRLSSGKPPPFLAGCSSLHHYQARLRSFGGAREEGAAAILATSYPGGAPGAEPIRSLRLPFRSPETGRARSRLFHIFRDLAKREKCAVEKWKALPSKLLCPSPGQPRSPLSHGLYGYKPNLCSLSLFQRTRAQRQLRNPINYPDARGPL